MTAPAQPYRFTNNSLGVSLAAEIFVRLFRGFQLFLAPGALWTSGNIEITWTDLGTSHSDSFSGFAPVLLGGLYLEMEQLRFSLAGRFERLRIENSVFSGNPRGASMRLGLDYQF